MRFTPLSKIFLFSVALGSGCISASYAQDATASEAHEIFGGTTEAGAVHAAGDVQRRVPFTHKEVQLSYAPLVKAAAPAVVNVYASRRQERAVSPFAGDPFFEQFFGRRQVQPRANSALGSGVIVDPSGLIVTNHHVIKDADKIKVALADGREFDSEILLQDESLDLAVLKIGDTEVFPTIAFGDSESLEIGDLVLAIGNPFGVGQTTTSGIVSALARTHVGVKDFGFFVQTDAAINPGNSGGALVDMAGRLAGINTAIYSRSGGSIGIGFAIPSNMVKAVVASAKAGKDHFERPFIGATFDGVTAEMAEALGLRRPFGALVSNILPGGPAEIGGLRPGDVIISVNDFAIESPDALGYRIVTQAIGNDLQIKVMRQNREAMLKVQLAQAPDAGDEFTIDGQSVLTGATIADLSPRLAQRFHLPITTAGVVILDVLSGSPANKIGLRSGDIVREVNGVKVQSGHELVSLSETETRLWRVTIEREGRLIQQTLRF